MKNEDKEILVVFQKEFSGNNNSNNRLGLDIFLRGFYKLFIENRFMYKLILK